MVLPPGRAHLRRVPPRVGVARQPFAPDGIRGVEDLFEKRAFSNDECHLQFSIYNLSIEKERDHDFSNTQNENRRLKMEDLRYPVGEFSMPASVTPAMRAEAIAAIAELPVRMREAARGLSEGQLDTPYRPGGWTVRQVVHHVPDSHMNAFVRLKLALTEDNPTVKPYDQEKFADLPDQRLPIEPSLAILDGLHARWVTVLRALAPQDFTL